jgi:hypothetical protein
MARLPVPSLHLSAISGIKPAGYFSDLTWFWTACFEDTLTHGAVVQLCCARSVLRSKAPGQPP